jgi:hypothetical protein
MEQANLIFGWLGWTVTSIPNRFRLVCLNPRTFRSSPQTVICSIGEPTELPLSLPDQKRCKRSGEGNSRLEPQSVSPDGRWAVAQVALPESEVSRGVVAYHAQGGAPLPICRTLCFVKGTLDGKFIYVHLLGTSQFDEAGRTLVMQTSSANPFPQLPDSEVQSESDLVALPGPRSWKEAFFRDPIGRDTHSPNKVSTGACIGCGPVNARNAGRDGPQYPLTIGLSFRIPFKVVNHIAGSRRRVGMSFRHSN